MALFQIGKVDAHLGSRWQIDIAALTKQDWEVLASILVPRLPAYREVIAVPDTGEGLAEALRVHRSEGAEVIVLADGVWTTGRALREQRNQIELDMAQAAVETQRTGISYIVGAVGFALSIPEPWVRSAFVAGGLSIG